MTPLTHSKHDTECVYREYGEYGDYGEYEDYDYDDYGEYSDYSDYYGEYYGDYYDEDAYEGSYGDYYNAMYLGDDFYDMTEDETAHIESLDEWWDYNYGSKYFDNNNIFDAEKCMFSLSVCCYSVHGTVLILKSKSIMAMLWGYKCTKTRTWTGNARNA